MNAQDLETAAVNVAAALKALAPLEPIAIGLVEIVAEAISDHMSQAQALTAAEAQWLEDEALSRALMKP